MFKFLKNLNNSTLRRDIERYVAMEYRNEDQAAIVEKLLEEARR